MFTHFRDREIKYCGMYKTGEWNFKQYQISTHDYKHHEQLLACGRELIDKTIELNSIQVDSHKQGFSISHYAQDGDFIVVCWWTGENMLASRAFYSPKGEYKFEDIQDTYITACVWELEIFNFERSAWIDYILKKAKKPNFKQYQKANISRIAHYPA